MKEHSIKNVIDNVVYEEEHTIIKNAKVKPDHVLTHKRSILLPDTINDYKKTSFTGSNGLGYLIFYFYYLRYNSNRKYDFNNYLTDDRINAMKSDDRYSDLDINKYDVDSILYYAQEQIISGKSRIRSDTLDLKYYDILKIADIMLLEKNKLI